MTEVQTCLACQDTEARCAAELERLNREVHFLEREKDEAFQRVQELEHINRKLERQNYRLAHKDEEPGAKIKKSESEEIQAWLWAWDERRMQIPGARKLNPKTLTVDGSAGKLVRAARRVWSHEDLMKCVKGAGISEWHTAELGRFKVTVLIGEGQNNKRDEKIQAHIDRWERYERLTDAGFQPDFARREAQHAPPPLVTAGKPAARCPECGRDTEREGCFCRRKWMEAAA